MDNDEVFTIRARKCLKCGRLLTSEQAIIDGYGACCLRRMKQAAVEREAAKNQYSLFPIEEEDAGPIASADIQRRMNHE